MTERHIEYVAIDELVPATRNARRHDVPSLRAKMSRFGYLDPVIVDGRTGRIVGGHGRVEALAEARTAGLEPPEGIVANGDGAWCVPVTKGWASRDDIEADAANLALNPAPNDPGFDPALLVQILRDVDDASELTGTGYDDAALKALLASLDDSMPEGGTDPQLLALAYAIVVECRDETHQGELLASFADMGIEARPIIG